jgi:hypothetical protein
MISEVSVSSELNLAFGTVLSREPLVTISKRARWLKQPMGFAGLIPNLDDYGPSLHFIGLCASLEPFESQEQLDPGLRDSPEDLARDWHEASKANPKALFVFLTNSEFESFALSRLGVPNFVANELMFIDESFYPAVERPEGQFEYDAVYNAGFYGFKRHPLAAEVDNLVLVAKRPLPGRIESVLAGLPKATLAGYDEAKGWRLLNAREVSDVYSRAAVGLCLSAIEGSMRVSMEYQLCGLPIVSTPSIGGRDRYFGTQHTVMAAPNPRAIAEGVKHAMTLKIPREHVRASILRTLTFDRRNFLREVNKLTQWQTGAVGRFPMFKPFKRFSVYSAGLSNPRFSPTKPAV